MVQFVSPIFNNWITNFWSQNGVEKNLTLNKIMQDFTDFYRNIFQLESRNLVVWAYAADKKL